MANRYWAHFFGRGIVDPLDDVRITNPPSNPELLDALAKDFVDQQVQPQAPDPHICNSAAYRLSSVPNEFNKDDKQSYARYYPRRHAGRGAARRGRPGARSADEVPRPGRRFPDGTRAIELPDEAVPSHFLDVFGRPARNSACECERVERPALGQTLELVSSAEIQEKLTADKG